MGVHSGKFGVVSGQTAVRNWTLNETSSPERYRASNTVFGSFTNPGIGDWSGSFSGFGGSPPLTIMPGDVFSFSGYTAPGTDIFGNIGVTYAGTAIVDSMIIEWNWQPAQSLMWTCNFSASTGNLTKGTGVNSDVSVAVLEKMCGLKIDVGASASEVVWPNIMSATLTMTAENVVYVNSSTNCFTGRKPGPFEWTLDVTEHNEDQVYAKGTNQRIRCFTSPSAFWLLEWGHLVEYTGLTCDRETGEIIQKTANFVMNGSDGQSLGQVTHPSGTDIWPEIAT